MDYLIAKEPEKSDYLIEPEPETPAQPQGLMSKAKDTAVSFGIGANSLLQMAGDFYGLGTGDMDNVVSRQARENIQYLQQSKSPELRQAEEARRKAIEADEDELGKALTYVRQTVTNPSLLSNALAEQVPNLVGTGGAGALAKAGAEKVLLKTAADQAAKRLAAKKAAQIGTGAAVAAGAGMQGTDVGADLYDEAVSALDKITDEQAMSIPEIASLMEEKDATLDEAKTAFALALGREAFALGATVSAGAQMLPGGRTIERAFVGKQAGRRLAGAITGGLGEAASEAVEEGGSRVAANLLARQFEPDRPLAKGVGEAVGQAAVVGGIPGAAFGAASSRPTPQPAPEGQTTAGKTGEAPASAATNALAGAPEVALESSEGLTPEQFYAAVNIRQARLMGGQPDPEDIRIAGEVPLPKVQIDPEKANRAIEEAQSALQEWVSSTPNAPQTAEVIFDPELLHNGYGVQGYYKNDGTIAINAAFVTPDRVASIANHEWAHQTLATEAGQKAFADFVQREIPQGELDALAARYKTQDRRVLLEEWIAQNQEKAPGVIERIVARIREWLAGVGIVDLSDAEVADIMLRTLRQRAENRIQPDTFEAMQPAQGERFSLSAEPKRISGVMASPSITDINYDRAKRNLTSANQARFKSQISEYAPEAEIFDAVGDWADGSENSVAAIFQDRKSGDELQRLAAQVGLAGDQKAVLWWRTEPEGADAIHEMVWPKSVSMDEARQAMIDVGLENRTLIQTPEGVRGFVFDQGRQNLNKIEALNEHETQPSLESSPAAGDFLGSWTSRAEGRRAYRRVLGSTPQAQAGAGELRSGEVGGVGDRGEPETRFSLAQTKTPEFKSWFGDSKIVTPEGNPRVMYHGTFSRRYFLDKLARIIPGKPDPDFTVFKPGGRSNAIFVSPSQAFASKFAADTEDLGKSSFFGITPEELAQERPGARVYPVFVKAENPFDYQNPEHIQKLFGDEEYLELVPGSKNSDTSDIYGSVDYDGVTLQRFEVENGHWDAIEDLSDRIKNAGFDGFYVRENGVKNLGVFTSKQLASATGNVGAFGQRPVTAEEARRMGLTEEEAAKAQAEGDIRFSLTDRVAQGRDTVLAAEAQKLKRGETTPAKYARKVEQRMPLRPFEEVPEPATDEDILRGLANRMAGDRLKRELRANPEDIEGQQVEARLDIPSYEDANVWTVTLHLPRERADSAGKVMAYTPTAILRDVTFTVNETAAMNVAAGARKSSFATMDGTYVPATARSAYEQAVEAKESGDWVEIGMNPIRHSYFYDKSDQRPVVSAEEVIQVGGLVLGRGVQYGEKSDQKFSLSEEPVEQQVEEAEEGVEETDSNLVLSAEAERERPDLPPTSALNTLYAQKSSISVPETGKRTNGQVAEQLRQAALKYWGRKLDSSNLNADEIERIVDNGVEEVIAGLKASNHAGNWYTTAIRKAMAIAAVLHPELGNDALAQKAYFKDAKAAEVGLSLAMAITSQNLNVEKNTEYANEQFEILKRTGRFDPSKEYGSKMEAISGNLRLANTLLDKVGWDGAEDFLNREYTVKELNEIASQVLGQEVSIAGKVDDLVNGSAIFGPKIGGGFFQNLRANFNPVTVDLWMRRTWGRWTGDVLPEPLNAPRLARMLEGMREAGIQLPEQLRSIRTVLATEGRKVPTLTDKAAQRILSDPAKVNAAYDFAAEQDSRWNKMYSEVRQNITPEQAAAVRAGELSLEQLNRLQQKSIREKRDAWQSQEDRPSGSSKEGRDAQKKFFEEMDAKAGRTAKLTNKELSKYKPEWAKSSRVITTLLKPVDVPSDLDRRVIVDVVNRIRAELQNQGVNATNADIQAILWYPEKDIWAKLAGKKESKLKSSYDEEFLRVAEAQGLGSEARDAAGRVGD